MLKNTLSLLLSKFYSKKESELVGHQAMPSTDNVALTPTTTSIDGWGAVCNGVAPTDGFACIRFTADTATCIASAQTPNVNVFTTPQVVGDILLCACPIAKGQVFTLCAREAKNIECWFTKTIGGGYQALNQLLLQGDVLCRLSRLYSSLRRSSCRVRRNGSEVKVFSQTQIPEQRSLLTTLRLSFIRLQVMDGLHSAETGHRSMSALPESWERVALTLKVISELQLRFGRGIPLVSIARRTISNRLRQNSFLAKGQRSTSLVGGASC